MGKRHQATRRRSYGRRQHEVHERDERSDGLDLMDGAEEATLPQAWRQAMATASFGPLLPARGMR
jgi:hypothetical protein